MSSKDGFYFSEVDVTNKMSKEEFVAFRKKWATLEKEMHELAIEVESCRKTMNSIGEMAEGFANIMRDKLGVQKRAMASYVEQYNEAKKQRSEVLKKLGVKKKPFKEGE